MLNPGYTSIERVVENVIRDTGFTDEINFPDMVEWAFIAMELIGITNCYIQKVTDGNTERGHYPPIEIIDYRAELPCDFHKLISLREYFSHIPMIQDSGTFLQSSNNPVAGMNTNITYTINNNFVFTNIETGYIEVSYWAFPTDEGGMPMIPDDVMYIRAVEAYLTERMARKLWIQGKLADNVYRSMEQDWLFYVNSPRTKAALPSYDQAESLKNQILRIVQRPNQASWGYAGLTNQEQSYINRYRNYKTPLI